MTDTKPLFESLRNSADPQVVAAIEGLIADGSDRELCRVNVLSFAAKRGLDEEKATGGFLHAARLGLFELTWNVLCPGCGGVLDVTSTLKSVHKEAYDCALCASGYEPTLDAMVEVAFTVNPRVRRIAAHDPHMLPVWATSFKGDTLTKLQGATKGGAVTVPMFVAQFPSAVLRPTIPYYFEGSVALQLALQQALTGQKTPKDALDAAAAKWSELAAK